MSQIRIILICDMTFLLIQASFVMTTAPHCCLSKSTQPTTDGYLAQQGVTTLAM